MEYTAEDYIAFIESGRFDKISINGMKLIAEKYRLLEEEIKGQQHEIDDLYIEIGFLKSDD